jgi:hypothetical protein
MQLEVCDFFLNYSITFTLDLELVHLPRPRLSRVAFSIEYSVYIARAIA